MADGGKKGGNSDDDDEQTLKNVLKFNKTRESCDGDSDFEI